MNNNNNNKKTINDHSSLDPAPFQSDQDNRTKSANPDKMRGSKFGNKNKIHTNVVEFSTSSLPPLHSGISMQYQQELYQRDINYSRDFLRHRRSGGQQPLRQDQSKSKLTNYTNTDEDESGHAYGLNHRDTNTATAMMN